MNESSVGHKSNIAFSPTDDFASIGSIVTSLLTGVNHDDEVDSILPPDFSLSERALLRALTNPIEPGHFDRRRREARTGRRSGSRQAAAGGSRSRRSGAGRSQNQFFQTAKSAGRPRRCRDGAR